MAEKLLNRSGGHDPCRGDGGAAWAITNPGSYTYAYDPTSGLMTTITRVLDGVTSVKTLGYEANRLVTESDWIAQ